LNDPADRVQFVRWLYNVLRAELDQDQDQATSLAINELNESIQAGKLASMFTKDVPGGCDSSRKRVRKDDGHQDRNDRAGRDLDDRLQLRAHGFEVKPEVIVDDSGGTLEPLFEVPSPFSTYSPC